MGLSYEQLQEIERRHGPMDGCVLPDEGRLTLTGSFTAGQLYALATAMLPDARGGGDPAFSHDMEYQVARPESIETRYASWWYWGK